MNFEEKMVLYNHFIKSDGIQIFQTCTERKRTLRSIFFYKFYLMLKKAPVVIFFHDRIPVSIFLEFKMGDLDS